MNSRPQAEAILQELVEDYHELDQLSDEEEGREIDEWKMRAPVSAYRMDGRLHWEWGLAGPRLGLTSIRLSGLVSEQHDDPETVRLEYLNDGRLETLELTEEERRALLSLAAMVVGSSCSSMVEEEE